MLPSGGSVRGRGDQADAMIMHRSHRQTNATITIYMHNYIRVSSAKRA